MLFLNYQHLIFKLNLKLKQYSKINLVLMHHFGGMLMLDNDINYNIKQKKIIIFNEMYLLLMVCKHLIPARFI